MFHVGQEVICINGKGWWNTFGETFDGPGLNEKVTIVLIRDSHIGITLGLAEYPMKYLQTAFRPIEKRKTDISVFNSVLNNTKVEEPA